MIKPVYRVQCDGPGREWLSLPDDYVPGTDLMSDVLIAADTAERAGNWPGEREAQRAAVGAGWRPTAGSDFKTWLCPACQGAGATRNEERGEDRMSENTTPDPTPLSDEAMKRIYAFVEFSYPPPFQPTADQTRALFEHLGQQGEAAAETPASAGRARPGEEPTT